MRGQINSEILLSRPPAWSGLGFVEASLSICWKVVAAVVAYRLQRAADRQLGRLDDRMMRDIGLLGGQIGSPFVQVERLRDQAMGHIPFC